MINKSVLQIENIQAETLALMFDNFKNEIIKEIKNNNPSPTAEYLTRKDVAKLFGVSLVTVHNWMNEGLLIPYKIANRTRFKRSEVESSLERKDGRQVQ
jgi:excisionase family DNA binding protein